MEQYKEGLVLRFDSVRPRVWGAEFASEINFEIRKGEQWCILGENGAGKTMLCDVICGKTGISGGEIRYGFFDPENKPDGVRFASDFIRMMSFESAYRMADYKNMYYQQRFNALENELAPTVADVLRATEEKYGRDDRLFEDLSDRLALRPLMQKHIIMLSSGELRRFLIASTLMSRPKLLVVDNPFIGLDKGMMRELDEVFTALAEMGWQMVFSCPAEEEIPTCATHILTAKGMAYGSGITREEYFANENNSIRADLFEKRNRGGKGMPRTVLGDADFNIVMRMRNINISYPTRTLFKDLNWTINKGEKWSLTGQNGAGKSTLLSLLAADNPKAYTQDILLFDRQRGTGESIWDIKRHIGYISSEMHLYFREDQSCLKIVASGFFDTIGLFRKPSDEQKALAMVWMEKMGIARLAERSFLKVSGGEQRLVLICRTLVKNPDLLILDEPLHGLDIDNKQMVREIIEEYAAQEDKTMIYVTHRGSEIPACVTNHYELKRIE